MNQETIVRDFFLGLIRLHILYHGAQGPIFGLQLIQELGTHGYELSAGTLYPILHRLEREGFLASQKQVVQGKVRKYYRTTESGQEVLREASGKVLALIDELGISSGTAPASASAPVPEGEASPRSEKEPR